MRYQGTSKKTGALDETKLLETLQQLRKDWIDRFGLEGEAGLAANDVLDLIWDIKSGKYDLY